MTPDEVVYAKFQAKAADLLKVDVRRMSERERLNVANATACLIELDRLDHDQRRGVPVDVRARSTTSDQLASLIPQPASDGRTFDIRAVPDDVYVACSVFEALQLALAYGYGIPIDDNLKRFFWEDAGGA